jgi:hypothetical protein
MHPVTSASDCLEGGSELFIGPAARKA